MDQEECRKVQRASRIGDGERATRDYIDHGPSVAAVRAHVLTDPSAHTATPRFAPRLGSTFLYGALNPHGPRIHSAENKKGH